jgi:hypothetical protein
MADLCTLAEAKAHLNISVSTFDAELASFITVASDLVEAEANRVWRDTSYVEYHKGGQVEIALLHTPVKTITSIVDESGTVSASDYTLLPASGIVRRKVGEFAGDDDDVIVTYTAGGTVPALARHATLETLRHLWATQRGTMAGRTALQGDEPVAGSSYSLPRRAIELIERLTLHNGIG